VVSRQLAVVLIIATAYSILRAFVDGCRSIWLGEMTRELPRASHLAFQFLWISQSIYSQGTNLLNDDSDIRSSVHQVLDLERKLFRSHPVEIEDVVRGEHYPNPEDERIPSSLGTS
jgi:hypothetical protein